MYLHKNKEPKKGIELIHVKLPTNFSKKTTKKYQDENSNVKKERKNFKF